MFKSIKKQFSQFVQVEESFNIAASSLEKIYKLEQIDIRSIRKLSQEEPITVEPLCTQALHKAGVDGDLGFLPEGKRSIDSFLLEEPVHVLGLSPHVEKLLISLNIVLLQDLINRDPLSLIHMKGMGQGHIDEIKEKLGKYIAGKVLKGCQQIDFESWTKSLMPTTDKKRSYLVLDLFDLSHLVSLSPSESVDIRRLSVENKMEWLIEGKKLFRTYDSCSSFKKRLHEIIEVFLKPWMIKRLGFVKNEELLERLDRLSLVKGTFPKAYNFFQQIFCDNECPLKGLMLHKYSLFFASQDTLDAFETVEKGIDTYFYNKNVSYPINQLAALIESEFSKKWVGFNDGFVMKVIRYLPHLNCVRKNGVLYVCKKE